MKFTCTQENIKYGLSLLSPVSSKNVNLPILNNILIQVEDSAIKFIATNLEIAVSCIVRGKIEENGSYTIPARLLSDYIQLLPKEKVEISLLYGAQKDIAESVFIQCGNFKTKIKGVASSDFPLVPKIDRNVSFLCPLENLQKAINQVIFSVSQNESRPELCGVLMNFSKNTLTLAATDSYRLAEKVIEVKSSEKSQAPEEQKVIIPSRALHELSRILSTINSLSDIENIEEVQICFSDNQIVFIAGNIEFTSRLIEGQYPDYRQIIPERYETELNFSVAELTQVIKSASLFARSGVFDVHFSFFPEENYIEISSGNTQVGENTCKISTKISGKKNNVVLNYRYILDVLQNIDSSQVEFRAISDANPCVLRPENDPKYLYIIMPIKQ